MRKGLVTFWWMPADQEAFLEYITKRWEIIAFTEPWKKSREEIVPFEFSALVRADPAAALMFGRADQMRGEMVSTHDFPGSGVRFNVTAESANVLWYRRGARSDGKLTLCTIGAYWDSFGAGASATKPKDFEKWGRSILRWIRERTPEKEGYYRCSSLVKQAIDAGAVELVPY